MYVLQVKENQDVAHQKQKKGFEKRASKGVKSFDFSVGDMVYKRNLKDAGRKGGTLNPRWTGPYR